MKAEIVGKNLVITVPLTDPTPSASGKTLVVASSHGNKETEAKVNGKPVVIGFNAYITTLSSSLPPRVFPKRR